MLRLLKRLCARWLWLLLLMTLPGCGPENPLGRRAIDGHITLDGSPLASGHIQFVPQDAGGVSSGAIIAQGSYKLEAPKGLPPGKYYVQIFSPRKEAKADPLVQQTDEPPGPFQPATETIPARYNRDTTLAADVPPSGSTTFDFDLKSK